MAVRDDPPTPDDEDREPQDHEHEEPGEDHREQLAGRVAQLLWACVVGDPEAEDTSEDTDTTLELALT